MSVVRDEWASKSVVKRHFSLKKEVEQVNELLEKKAMALVDSKFGAPRHQQNKVRLTSACVQLGTFCCMLWFQEYDPHAQAQNRDKGKRDHQQAFEGHEQPHQAAFVICLHPHPC